MDIEIKEKIDESKPVAETVVVGYRCGKCNSKIHIPEIDDIFKTLETTIIPKYCSSCGIKFTWNGVKYTKNGDI